MIQASIAHLDQEPRKELRGGRLFLTQLGRVRSFAPASLEDGERVFEKGLGRSAASAGRIGLEHDGQVSCFVDGEMSRPPPR